MEYFIFFRLRVVTNLQIFFVILIVALTFITTSSRAQSVLTNHVTVRQMSKVKLGHVLEQIEKAGRINIVYNNRTVHADSVVNVAAFNGLVYELLNRLLGDDYELREIPGYVIIRFAPEKLVMEANFENDGTNDFKIKGCLLDYKTKKPVYRGSVYEKTLLISTLTDERGLFELKIKKPASVYISLTASKENYRDTSLNLLQEVAVVSKPKLDRDQYDASAEASTEKIHRGLSGILIGTRQKIQDLNIGSMFQKSPYQMSLIPGLSTHGIYSSQVIDKFSVNILGGYSAGTRGLEGAFLFNIDRNDVRYVQAAGLFNIVGGDVAGVQAAGVFNQVYNRAKGVQFAGLFNRDDEFTSGLQLAPLNIDKRSRGVMVGIVNIADSADYAFGLINIIKNGNQNLGVSTDETRFTHITFRSGGKYVYGIVGIGFKLIQGRLGLTADRGLGFHLLKTGDFDLDAEGVSEYLFNLKDGNYQINTIRVLPSLSINKRVKLFAGPSLDLTSWEIPDKVSPVGWTLGRYYASKDLNVLTLGITGGLQINL